MVGTENVASDTDLVIEAVFEDFGVKTEVFGTLDEVCNAVSYTHLTLPTKA